MRYIIISLVIILYVIWTYYAIKDYLMYKGYFSETSILWLILHFIVFFTISFILTIEYIIPFVIDNW